MIAFSSKGEAKDRMSQTTTRRKKRRRRGCPVREHRRGRTPPLNRCHARTRERRKKRERNHHAGEKPPRAPSIPNHLQHSQQGGQHSPEGAGDRLSPFPVDCRVRAPRSAQTLHRRKGQRLESSGRPEGPPWQPHPCRARGPSASAVAGLRHPIGRHHPWCDDNPLSSS